MKCIKCGKKIPSGLNRMCEECQKKLIKDIEKDEDKKTVKKAIDDGRFTLGEKIFLVICLIVIVFSLSVSSYTLIKKKIKAEKENLSTTDSLIGNKIGNTIANIRYYGYCAMEGDWIYYFADNEDFSASRICRIKNTGASRSIIFEQSELSVYSINAINGYIYFTGITDGAYSETDTLDNKIYRMKNDGSDVEVINNNNFSNITYSIYVIKDKIYFTGTDENVYKMNLDGTNIEQVLANGTGFVGVNERYILYDSIDTVDGKSAQVTYIVGLDGKDPKPIVAGKKLYHVNIENDYIYYLDKDQHIYRIKIGSNKEELLYSGTAYLLNVYNNYAYYFNYTNEEATTVGIYKLNLLDTSSKPELVKTLSKMSYYVDVVRDYANYLDSNDKYVSLNLLKTDGSLNNIQLFTYSIEDVQKYYVDNKIE